MIIMYNIKFKHMTNSTFVNFSKDLDCWSWQLEQNVFQYVKIAALVEESDEVTKIFFGLHFVLLLN